MKILIFIFLVVIILCIFKILNKATGKYLFLEKFKRTDIIITGIILLSSIVIIYSLVIVNYFLENPTKDENGKIEYLGTIGDLIGGVINPAIAVPATLLTFLAFWVQYKANDEVRKQFDIQKFESELNLKITILRQEITELRLPINRKEGYVGREVMYQLDKELKFIYFIVKNSLCDSNYQKILSISYYIFFKGRLLFYKNIFSLSKKHNIPVKELSDIEDVISSIYTFFKVDKKELSPDDNSEEKILDKTSLLNKAFNEGFKIKDVHEELDDFNTVYYLFTDIYSSNIYHLPFKGHETKLSLLFRQIFNIVKFISSEKDLTYEQKRSYLRTLRSVLSNYDQMHIFYNWHSETAIKWEDFENKFLTDMRIIHNIPIDLLIEDFKLEEIFTNRNFMFESGRRETDSLFENIEIYSERAN